LGHIIREPPANESKPYHLDGIDAWKVEKDCYILFGAQSALVGAIWTFALPRAIPGYFELMSFGLLVVLACIIARSEKPIFVVIGVMVVIGLNELAQMIPVGPEIKGHLPALCVGVAYVVVMLLTPLPAADLLRRVLDRPSQSEGGA